MKCWTRFVFVFLAKGNLSLTAVAPLLAQKTIYSNLLKELFWLLQLAHSGGIRSKTNQEYMSG